MGAYRSMRASDEERDDTAEVLRGAYVAGRLDAEEFAERSLTAYAARTRGELDDLTADLPTPPIGPRPTEIVSMRDIAWDISYRRRVGKAVTCLLFLLAGGCCTAWRGR